MTRSLLLPIVGLSAAAIAGAVVYVAINPGAAGESGASNPSAEVLALRSQVDDLKREMSQMRDHLASQTATANTAPVQTRETAKATEVAATVAANNAPIINVSQIDRDTIFALIKEERDLRDKERQEKQKQQMKDGLSKRIQQSLDRIGVDAATKDAVTKIYLENFAREEEIRKAYPIQDFMGDDPNIEKRRQELDAARKDLEARVATMIPTDKKEDWDRSTRFLNRAGDMAGMADAFRSGDFPMMGGGGFGGFGASDRGRNDNNSSGGGGRQNRQNRNNNNAEPKPQTKTPEAK
ncbi:MAG: hypothetical protein ACKVS6_14245 [Planctomycetota bacterium]